MEKKEEEKRTRDWQKIEQTGREESGKKKEQKKVSHKKREKMKKNLNFGAYILVHRNLFFIL